MLFFLAAALGDTGGSLFWPILAVFLGLVGLVGGLMVEGFRGRSRPQSPTLQPEDAQSIKGEGEDGDSH